mmetsp:Transcript_20517/g.34336  ORF Transcript_20517/g.34336 Transcript_20517/m.34336 type:complete len:239 (-) Transcript_20517:250-966(-)
MLQQLTDDDHIHCSTPSCSIFYRSVMQILLSIVALALASTGVLCSDVVNLVTFDGAEETTSRRWILTNDPVMGGVSNSTWTVEDQNQQGVWTGGVEIVPSLDAPGFCNLMTSRGKWPSASGYTHMIIRAKSTIPYKGFKFSFGADTLNLQFKCFKADFEMESTGEWEDIYIPMSEFSNDWSSYTGEPITKCSDDPSVCPTDKNLEDIEQIGFWMEGAEGDFDFTLKHVQAGYAPEANH